MLGELVDAEWEARLGIDRSLVRSSGVHVVAADLGANDAAARTYVVGAWWRCALAGGT